MNDPFVRLIGFVGVFVAWPALGGPLNPPAGPVAGTGKTLAEIEPRIAINAANTPGDSNSTYRITLAGSYYLTGNVTGVSGKSGIEIATSGVVIDLMGFTLTGQPGSLDGIKADGVIRHITIRNGFVRNWGADGINLTAVGSDGSGIIEDIHATFNGETGITAADKSTIRYCAAYNNGSHGIVTGSDSTITGCTADNNTGAGIYAGNGATASGCTSSGNDGLGFFGGHYVSYMNCTAGSNGAAGFDVAFGCVIVSCAAMFGDAEGFEIGPGSTVSNCAAHSNALQGFLFAEGCSIIGNVARSNLSSGFSTADDFSRLEGNTSVDNGIGYTVNGTRNFVARNIAAANNTNWGVAAGNVILVVQAATAGIVLGNSGGVSPGSTNPNANFTY